MPGYVEEPEENLIEVTKRKLKPVIVPITTLAASLAVITGLISSWNMLGWPWPAMNTDIDELREYVDERFDQVTETMNEAFAKKDRMDVIRQRISTLEKTLNVLPEGSSERTELLREIEDLREELEELENS